MSDQLNDIIRDHAMLVSLTIRGSRMEIKDNAAAQAAAEKSGAKSSAAYYAKKNLLFGADTRLRKLEKIGNALRTQHNELTMPWDNGKNRMLPVTSFANYTTVVATAKKEYEAALNDFIDNYEADARIARANLNLGEAVEALALYPRKDSLRIKFGLDVEFEPIPEGAKFRNLPEGVTETLAKAYEARVVRRYHEALAGAYEHVIDLAERALTNFKREPEDEKAQKWHNTAVYNVVESVNNMRTFAFDDRPDHDAFCARVGVLLGKYNDKELKALRQFNADRSGLIDEMTEIHTKATMLLDDLNTNE